MDHKEFFLYKINNVKTYILIKYYLNVIALMSDES